MRNLFKIYKRHQGVPPLEVGTLPTGRMLSICGWILRGNEKRPRHKLLTGFTLLETVVAISILMVGVIGPITLAQRNIKASREAGDRLVASFLAQEGIETMRNVIANTSADNGVWLTGVTSKCELPNGCGVDVSLFGQTSLYSCSGCTPTVYQDATTFVYRQSSGALAAPWAPTKFGRLTSVSVAEAGKRITASTTVWWPRGNMTLQEDIYNWFFQLN